MIKQNQLIFIHLLLFLGGFHSRSLSQPQLFQSHEPLPLILEFVADSVYADPCTEPRFHNGLLKADNRQFKVKVRKRGRFRCDRKNCANPPLMIDFGKKQVRETLFNHQNKLKLVMPCKPGSTEHIKCLYKEYLVYRLLNQITPMSLQVRLVDLTLVSRSSNQSDTLSMPAFLIEDDDAMAIRNGGEIWNASGVSASQTNRQLMTLIDVFQYMIGNTDWSVTEPHNIKILSTNPFEPPIAVPYDFDWCGLVSAPYAVPAPKLHLVNVRQRLYMGYCRSDEEWKAAFQIFRKKRNDIELVITEFPGLSESDKKRINRYLADFWELMDDPPLAIIQFRRECLEEEGKP